MQGHSFFATYCRDPRELFEEMCAAAHTGLGACELLTAKVGAWPEMA